MVQACPLDLQSQAYRETASSALATSNFASSMRESLSLATPLFTSFLLF
jgi:hypothetical protein